MQCNPPPRYNRGRGRPRARKGAQARAPNLDSQATASSSENGSSPSPPEPLPSPTDHQAESETAAPDPAALQVEGNEILMSDEERVENLELQNEELLALEAIYGEDLKMGDETERKTGVIRAHIELPEESVIIQVGDAPTSTSVRQIPPISLRFQLPPSYPSQSSPDFVLDVSWLDSEQRAHLARHLVELWEENGRAPCLYSFAEFLRSNALDILGALTNTDGRVAIALRSKDPDLVDELLTFDRAKEKEKFDAKLFQCGVCFNELRGSACVQFDPCVHVFCADCSREYFTVQVEEDLQSVGLCFDVSCTKRQPPAVDGGSQAAEDTHRGQIPRAALRELLGESLFERYDSLWQKKQLESRSDICFCPRPFCQAPANIQESESGDQTGVRMATCTHCGFCFCAVCQRSWHGNSTKICNWRSFAPIVESYLKASQSGDITQVTFLEKRYGEKMLRKMARDWENERESRKWLVENSKDCPECGLHVQKSDGCNHMTCSRCKTHFCYLCGAWLSPARPYTHFNQPGTACYQNLFEGAVDLGPGDLVDEEDWEVAINQEFLQRAL
ncbi:RWD-domain-containing protein [Gonapodya prolifera JEL478]|uniref:RBR-type E3 ubiquitin transferase n=1 Tax=Gonapodya prolifera (strain JEL478) TaxID=1344416 RepID=A0A139AX86_GONPJ|nr:RWD-domain-containing protein [Gonapodya prolifera JEL478]|eukprot:KXS21338.1 RWD-domain-containing protein [Gonapodya prolifera JEL478]